MSAGFVRFGPDLELGRSDSRMAVVRYKCNDLPIRVPIMLLVDMAVLSKISFSMVANGCQ